jgi:hypothetical protein
MDNLTNFYLLRIFYKIMFRAFNDLIETKKFFRQNYTNRKK